MDLDLLESPAGVIVPSSRRGAELGGKDTGVGLGLGVGLSVGLGWLFGIGAGAGLFPPAARTNPGTMLTETEPSSSPSANSREI